jgi:hypothetical protein
MIRNRTQNTELREPTPKRDVAPLSVAGEGVMNSRALATAFVMVGIDLLAIKAKLRQE